MEGEAACHAVALAKADAEPQKFGPNVLVLEPFLSVPLLPVPCCRHEKLVTLGGLACTAKRCVYGWRFGSRQCTGEDAYTPRNCNESQIPSRHNSFKILPCSLETEDLS
jgi:hypothetical protein